MRSHDMLASFWLFPAHASLAAHAGALKGQSATAGPSGARVPELRWEEERLAAEDKRSAAFSVY